MNLSDKHFSNFVKNWISQPDMNSILRSFADLIQVAFPPSIAAVVGIRSGPAPFVTVTDSDFTKKFMTKKNSIVFGPFADSQTVIRADGGMFFPVYDHEAQLRYVIVVSEFQSKNETEIQSLISNLQNLCLLFFSQRAAVLNGSLMETAQLVSHLAHDMNSLCTILDEHEIIQPDVSRKTSYLQRLHHDLLFYLRELDFTPVWMNVTNVVNALITEIPIPKEIRSTISIENSDFELYVDTELLGLALKNIIENAIRSVKIEGGHIEVKSVISPGHPLSGHKFWLTLSVKDNGPGISPDFIDRVKKPFFTTYKSQGHPGLGLAITEKIIHAHKGIIEVGTVSEGGVRVEIILPLKESS